MIEKSRAIVKVVPMKPMNLRDAWPGEASDFTPWLVENIGLLNDVLRVQLEVQAQEKAIGMFRADIVASDIATGETVLIENQIEQTNHGHLGQILTYAAGLQAATVVWIAAKFCDEHRAALDWLNECMSGTRFFGLEIELWRIENSLPAAKFNIVCSPNSWKKHVSLRRAGTAETRLQVAYERMIETGVRMSGRALAREARTNRDTASRWLAEIQGQAESIEEEAEE